MTSRYSPVNHICMGPAGDCTSMHTRRVPPTRTSIFATGMVAPSGPYHALKCSGSVHIRHMRSTEASKLRSITTASRRPCSLIVPSCPWLCPELSEVGVHPVEAGLPHAPVLLGPGRDLLEWCGVESTRPVLGVVAPDDQPRLLQHLDVLRAGRERHLERRSELVDCCLAFREARQDCSPRRVGKCREGLAEPILVD